MAGLIPPPSFGWVENAIVRSGQPNPINFPFLNQLGLSRIIWLAPEDPSPDFLQWATEQEVQFIHLGMKDSDRTPWAGVSEDTILAALSLLLDVNVTRTAIMCGLGRHRTGTLVACLRKLQRWNLTAIFEEYRRYAGNKVRLMNEQFIELFDTDLVRVSDAKPSWL